MKLFEHHQQSKFGTRFSKFRGSLHLIAQRTYPFMELNEKGEKLYLDQAYIYRYKKCEATLGKMPNMKCHRIFLWEQFLHLWGAILFWALAVIIDLFVRTPWNLILPLLVILYFAFQEFYIDHIKYHQRLLRSLIDWIIWGIPLIIYILIVLL
ncbi:hypothetical protein A2997_00920 [Candidatus Nomurabacteria bacterium RIFCSPLOWO2_01_FULL_36_10b]|uniref:Uncharacterized protein n=1 Tax=Candidatus Nomurabacteria bacterium RIFCSPLOWO2_01_FULL_36_10b TaxID=1801766 RepID=A0A1F6WQ96_9BACT|nr:MAG: hypothetical protein A2997_00920 [Candidatus Nomurabacteria bacterium RIFCSPLOWO2_01_FULL_36_10b]